MWPKELPAQMRVGLLNVAPASFGNPSFICGVSWASVDQLIATLLVLRRRRCSIDRPCFNLPFVGLRILEVTIGRSQTEQPQSFGRNQKLATRREDHRGLFAVAGPPGK